MSDGGCPVIYSLSHAGRGLLYIGSSRSFEQRRKFWTKALDCVELGFRPSGVTELFYDRASGTLAADWKIRVVQELACDVSRERVEEIEFAYMRCFFRLSPRQCLNIRREWWSDFGGSRGESFFVHQRNERSVRSAGRAGRFHRGERWEPWL